MRRITALLASFALILALAPVTALAVPTSQLDTSGDRIPGSWIVTLRDGVDSSAQAAALARQAGGRVGFVYEHALNGFSFKGSDGAAAALLGNPLVRSVDADRPMSIVAESVPTGVSRIDAIEAHGTEKGYGARVAILDTGIDLDHDDLQPNIDAAAGKNCIDQTKPPDDGHSHGTHVAGTVAAVHNDIGVIGVAPAAKVIPVKVLADNGSGSWESVICGVDHVTSLNENTDAADNVHVANMSLGGSGSVTGECDGALHLAICNSVKSGTLYAVAAGNDSTDASNFVPAAYPEVLTVSAYQDTDGTEGDAGCTGFPFTTCDEEFASFSNYGAIVDVIAPGVRINSTVLNDGYGSKSGTSMAAPHAAGVAALVRAADSSLGVTQIEDILRGTGECPDNSQNGGGASCPAATGSWDGDPESRAEPMVNAAWAVAAAGGGGSGTGTLSGTVTDASTTSGIDQATVSIDGTTLSATTDSSGNYAITGVPVGNYTVTASASGYGSSTKSATISEDITTDLDFALTASGGGGSGTGTLVGTVTDASTTSGIGGATVSIDGTTTSATTDSSGNYEITGVPVGDYTVTASASGYGSSTKSATISEDTTTDLNFSLSSSAGTMHVESLTGSNENNGSTWTAFATIVVHDQLGDPVNGVDVTGSWGDGASGLGTCTTGSGDNPPGSCTISKSNIRKNVSSVRFTIDGLEDKLASDGTLTWDGTGPLEVLISKP